MTSSFQNRLETVIQEIETVVKQATAMDYKNTACDLTSQGQTSAHGTLMSASDYTIAFSGKSQSFCVGLVDIVNSTKVSANLREQDWCKYYAIFLNSMAKIINKFGGVTIKNGGDSLLYYFPKSVKTNRKKSPPSCIESGLAMVEVRDILCQKLKQQGLPPLNFRVSVDYGQVSIMNSNASLSIDLIGLPVSMCAKINRIAHANGMVVGNRLYQRVKDEKRYLFKPTCELATGSDQNYPVYLVYRG